MEDRMKTWSENIVQKWSHLIQRVKKIKLKGNTKTEELHFSV